jgi:YHS domain-containing protein
MEVDIATATLTAEKYGQTNYFCSAGCRRAFLAG